MNQLERWRDAETLPATRTAQDSRRSQAPCGGGAMYLHPGQVATLSGAYEITTIVGACVAVCLWDPMLRTGGMSRILVSWPFAADRSSGYGRAAVDRLVASLHALGCISPGLRARVVGGAAVAHGGGGSRRALGYANASAAIEALAEHDIAVASRDLGGGQARRLVFRVDTGELAVRPL
jgi:chemotaxis protein CheD